MPALAVAASDYARVEDAIHYLNRHYLDQPGLDTVARSVGLSPYHFQRLFRRWAGISPKRFVQYLSLAHAKEALADSESVLDAGFDAGLSGPGRLHDLFVTCEAMTPGEYKARGAGLVIRYGTEPSPFGPCLVLATARGVCGLAFVAEGAAASALAGLGASWSRARLVEDRDVAAAFVARAFAPADAEGPIRLHVKGTNFQIRVWEALLRIPPGVVVSYRALARHLARHLGRPAAARAVAGAVAANPVGFVIP
ncbi:MAG: helix-turn-helix domain-containing protein, partial [Alphaproteobacteria bacterium]